MVGRVLVTRSFDGRRRVSSTMGSSDGEELCWLGTRMELKAVGGFDEGFDGMCGGSEIEFLKKGYVDVLCEWV